MVILSLLNISIKNSRCQSFLYLLTSSDVNNTLPKILLIVAIICLWSGLSLILLSRSRNTSVSLAKARPFKCLRKILLFRLFTIETFSLGPLVLAFHLRSISGPILQKSTLPKAGTSGTPLPKMNFSPTSLRSKFMASVITSPRDLLLYGKMQTWYRESSFTISKPQSLRMTSNTSSRCCLTSSL